MTEGISVMDEFLEFQAFDISAAIQGEIALLTMATDRGRMVVQVNRTILSNLAYQISHALSEAQSLSAPPSRADHEEGV